MTSRTYISHLRQESRKLIRELGLLQLNQPHRGQSHSHWHALIEIHKEPGITISTLAKLLILSPSALSRVVDGLMSQGYVEGEEGGDRRQKRLKLTPQGVLEIKRIDSFSHTRIIGAMDYLSATDQQKILEALSTYATALEKSRQEREGVQIHTLPASRPIRLQVVSMIEAIQIGEYELPISAQTNACVLRPEEDFYYDHHCNFWYATAKDGQIIGSIGLKKLKGNCGEVKKFFVHPKHRGKGVAFKLMEKLVATAKKNNFLSIYLGTVSTLKTAHEFYKKAGFQEISQTDLPQDFKIGSLDTVFFRGETIEVLKYFKG